MCSIQTVRVHPKFFSMDPHFSLFSRRQGVDGVLHLQGDSFSFSYSGQSLTGDDEEVLQDLSNLIRSKYGTHLSRDQVAAKIRWDTVPAGTLVVKAGVCVLQNDKFSGWDGSINAVWSDDAPPGEVINVYYRFVQTTSLMDGLGPVQSRLFSMCEADRSAVLRALTAFEDASVLRSFEARCRDADES